MFAPRCHRLLCLLVVLAPLEGRAQDATSEETAYAAAIDEAVSRYEESDFGAARAAFTRAHALRPSARTFRGIGISALHEGDFVTAVDALRHALADDRRPLSDAQRAEATDLLARAERNVGILVITLSPESARLQIDGRPVVLPPNREVSVVTGPHAIRAELGGHDPVERNATVQGSGRVDIALTLAREPPVEPAPRVRAPAAEVPAPAVTHAAARDSGGRTWTWVALGAVPVFAGAATWTYLSGSAKLGDIEDACRSKGGCTPAERDARIDDAGLNAHATWATVAWTGAGAALTLGAVLFVVEGSERDTPSKQLAFGVTGDRVLVSGNFE